MEGADTLKAQLKGISGYVENNKQAFRTAGIALTAFGTAITGTMVLAVNAAINEKESIARLSVALKNVGIDYNNVRVSIEQLIAAQAKKTNYSDGQQRDALQQLVLITGNYDLALKALPAALDLAAAKQMDVSSAAVLMARAMNGNTEGLKRYGIEIPKDASASEVLNSIMLKVKGTAEATANPFVILKNTIGSLATSIGTTILPAITDLINWITNVVDWVKKWTEAHPELTRYIVIFASTLGLLATAIGPLLIMFPMVVTGLRSIMLAFLGVQAAAGPVAWAILGISVVLSALMPFLIGGSSATDDLTRAMKDLETQTFRMNIQTHFAADEWANIQKAGYLTKQQFEELATSLGLTNQQLGDQMRAAGMLMSVQDILQNNLFTLSQSNVYLKETTEDVTQALKDQADAAKELKAAEQDLNKAASDAVGLYMDEFRDAHNERMSAIDDEYNATINTINAELNATLAAYNSEVDALNNQIQAIDDAEQQKKDDITKAQLEAAVAYATTDKKRIAAQKELDDFLHKENIESQKDEIRDRIDTVRQLEKVARDKAADDAERARREYETEQRKLDDEYDANVSYLANSKRIYDTALTEQTDRYKADLAAFKALLQGKLPIAQDFVNSLEGIYAQLTPVSVGTGASGPHGAVCGASAEVSVGDSTASAEATLPSPPVTIPSPKVSPLYDLQPYQYGGLIHEPTLLTRLRDMRAYGIAGEAGAERISPLSGQMMTIIMEMDGRQIARTVMPYAIGELRLKTGLKQ